MLPVACAIASGRLASYVEESGLRRGVVAVMWAVLMVRTGCYREIRQPSVRIRLAFWNARFVLRATHFRCRPAGFA